jgi:RimJ/RimL family protein N-acetyltransferase
MDVRKAFTSDLPQVYEIYEATAAEGRWIGAELPIDRAERIDSWKRIYFDSEGGVLFVAEAGGDVVASATLSWDHRSSCGGGVLGLGMCVAKEHRGKGIGKELVRACIDWARAAGAHKITLQVWPHNMRARALYKRFGFEQEGYLRRHWQRTNGEKWDAVVMGLLLD